MIEKTHMSIKIIIDLISVKRKTLRRVMEIGEKNGIVNIPHAMYYLHSDPTVLGHLVNEINLTEEEQPKEIYRLELERNAFVFFDKSIPRENPSNSVILDHDQCGILFNSLKKALDETTLMKLVDKSENEIAEYKSIMEGYRLLRDLEMDWDNDVLIYTFDYLVDTK